MIARLPDVIVIRGAPGAGKSETARALAARLGECCLVEVDALRAMVVPADWTNQAEHIALLSLACVVVVTFVELGHRPVIVVDTFSGTKLDGFLVHLRALQRGLEIRVFALITEPETLRARVRARPACQFKDLAICEKLNAAIRTHPHPAERHLDNTALTPFQVAAAIAEALVDQPPTPDH